MSHALPQTFLERLKLTTMLVSNLLGTNANDGCVRGEGGYTTVGWRRITPTVTVAAAAAATAVMLRFETASGT